MISEVLLAGCLVTFTVHILLGKWNSPKNLPPGPMCFPVIGSLPQVAIMSQSSDGNTPYKVFMKLSRKYGSITSLTLGSSHSVVFEDCQHIKEVSNSRDWVDRHPNKWFARRFSRHREILGILTSSGEVWKETRQFTIRTLREFGFGKQKDMEMAIIEEINDLDEHLLEQVKSGKNIIKLRQYFAVSIVNILWSMVAGTRFSKDDAKVQVILGLMDELVQTNSIGSLDGPLFASDAFPMLVKMPFMYTKEKASMDKICDTSRAFFGDILKERRANGDYKNGQRDFIDVFLREIDAHKNEPTVTNHYTDDHFIALLFDLFFVGSETTNSSIEYAFLFMILHPEIQEKVQSEIDTVIGQCRPPSIADMPNMPYTEATLLEILRKANILPTTVRAAVRDTKVGGYDIEKGTLGLLNYYGMSMNERTWENASEFKPERFLDSLNKVINAEKTLHFGYGKRVCIGEALAQATMFIFFTTILQKYTLEQSPQHELPTSEPVSGLTLHPVPYYALFRVR